MPDVAGPDLCDRRSARKLRFRSIPTVCPRTVDQAGGCSYGYSCTYTDSISWASATAAAAMTARSAGRSSPVVRCRRHTAGARRAARGKRSILDWLGTATTRLKKELGAADSDAPRCGTFDEVREIERASSASR